jgi:ferric-dicitrate binding protein FerR (iron transport regulator)
MNRTEETNVPTQMATSSMNQEQTVEDIRQDSSITVKPTVFKNTPLKDIVQEIANYHQLSVVVNNHEAAALRLYYPWNPQMPAEQVIGELNRFEKVNLAIKDNQLIIE